MIRAFARATLEDTEALFARVDGAVLDATPERVQEEPALAEALRRANHANLTHWMTANAARPGARVPANLGPEVLELARDIVRRGFDQTSLNSYRVGQNAAIRFVMAQIFEATSDPALIRELMEVTTRSVFAFVDDTLAGIEEEIGREREQLVRGTHAQRLEVVNLVLERAPISERRAGTRLGYELSGRHLGAVVWLDGEGESAALESAATALAERLGSARHLSIVAGARSAWVWFPLPREAGQRDPIPERELLESGVRAALGGPARGIEGFRRTHMEALTTQRLMARSARAPAIASYEEVRLVALTASDEGRATEFARETLGDLGTADPVLRETLAAYIRADFNTSAAARALYAHRNTVLNRLSRAKALLPGPLEGRGLEIGLALEIDAWLGAEAAG